MKKALLFLVGSALLTGMTLFGNYWITTQPVWITYKTPDLPLLNASLSRNQQLINFIENHGKAIAPTYEDAVCTEFVIDVIEQFVRLTIDEKSKIRILTKANLNTLLANDSPVIKGVQTALLQNNKGIAIEQFENVKPGDFVQFWNEYQGKAYGHCGIVLAIDPHQSITVYSSHPLTWGYGKQKFLWPEKIFFVRLI